MDISGASEDNRPIYEREGWQPMSEDEISRALEQLQDLPGAEMMYLPEFYCKRKGLSFEGQNRTMSLKEAIEAQKRKPLTTRERLQAKLDDKRKSTATTK